MAKRHRGPLSFGLNEVNRQNGVRMMLELPIKATKVGQVPPGNLIRVNESGKSILGILVTANASTFLLAFEPSANSPAPNTLVPIDPTESAMDYGSKFRFNFGFETASISIGGGRFSSFAGTLVLTVGATLMATRYATTGRVAYVEIASGAIAQKEPLWGSCVLIGGWTLVWWPTLDTDPREADPWEMVKRKAPVTSQ
jgi:hypothetical protein